MMPGLMPPVSMPGIPLGSMMSPTGVPVTTVAQTAPTSSSRTTSSSSSGKTKEKEHKEKVRYTDRAVARKGGGETLRPCGFAALSLGPA